MTTTGLIFDLMPDYLPANMTLLQIPVGSGRLANRLETICRRLGASEQIVVAPIDADASYAERLSAILPQAEFVSAAELPSRLAGCELSDRLVLLHAGFVPDESLDLDRLRRELAGGRMVQHVLPIERDPRVARERVLLDGAGRVRKIERLYDGVTRLSAAGVTCSVGTVAALRDALIDQPLESLTRLRHMLAEHAVPHRDVILGTHGYRLTVPRALHAFQMEDLFQEIAACTGGRRSADADSQIRIGANARIDPTARLYGPLIVQSGVTVEAGVVLIGPCVLGAGAEIGPGAILARCSVLPDVRVAPGDLRSEEIIGVELSSLDSLGTAAAIREDVATRSHLSLPPMQRHTGVPPARSAYLMVKRLVDAVASAAGLLLLSPLLLPVAILVKLTSRGPIFFGHEREGYHGRVFRCWKFRSMFEKANDMQRALYKQNAVDGPQFKMDDDPRVTPLGRILRTTNIDELPQLWNVLRGDMSLIGPRPSPFRENQICVGWRQARLSVRPGITGLWQVCRHERSAGDFHQWIYYDVQYVRHLSAMLDLKILLATFTTLGGRFGVPIEWMVRGVHREHSAGFSEPLTGTEARLPIERIVMQLSQPPRVRSAASGPAGVSSTAGRAAKTAESVSTLEV